MTVRLIANHPRRRPYQTVWTLWGADEECLRERLEALRGYRTLHYANPEIVSLMLRRDDTLGTIEAGWTREAVDELVRTLPDRLADIRDDLAALFAPTPRAATRRTRRSAPSRRQGGFESHAR